MGSILTIALGCRTNKALVKPIKDRSPSFLTKRMEKSLFEYESISFKTDVSIRMKDEKRSFKANVRMQKDSAIWMSISPALGIEVARVILTEDSIKLVDKWNDQYYLGNYDYINDIFDADFDFKMLQDLMVANPVMYDPKEKFVATKDHKDYILTSKNKRKVRKALGLDKNLLKDESETEKDTLRFNVDTRKLRKAITKEDEEDLIVKRYWINPGSYKLDKTIIRDIYYNRTFKVEYLKYDKVALMEFPDETEILLEDDDNTTKVQMEHSRVRVNKSLKFPFVIPEKFERIQ
ncbi:MAG: DUF4292 domain-containing protein [Flavobacteriales bacterium]|nr:DUF4292 domain-containing protein [Flavobacteriales bacterium]